MFKLNFPELPSLYFYLIGARIILNLLPQTGYIHPDEFFQTIEVQAGKALAVEYNPPWEYNASFPVRSATIPYFTFGIIYRLTEFLDLFLSNYFVKSIITPYLLVVVPRLFICILSFLIDFSLYKICVNNNEKYKNKLVVLASCYVMIVYGTRTFTNTIEMILFALLQYYVCESLTFSNMLVKKREYLQYRYETSQSAVEKAKFHKLKLFLVSDSIRNCFEVATITVMGFFNRPTFLAFALFPIFFWLYRGLGNKLVTPMNYHLRIIVLILCSIPSLLFHVLVDSFFYGYVTWGEVGVFDITINNFVFTPLNFLKYNINSKNLAEHGLHPRFLHIIVNMPLLFNILALITFYRILQDIYNLLRGKHQLLPTVRSIKGLMTLSFIAPLVILSIFPHQEPRFLIPLIIPLVYLNGMEIYPEKDKTVSKPGRPPIRRFKTSLPKESLNVYMKLWLFINFVLVVFFGFLHQGGVYHAANYLSNEMKTNYSRNEYYILTSHIYPIPQSFLLQKSSENLRYYKTTKYILPKRYFLYEEGSANLELVIKDIKTIKKTIHDKQLSVKNLKKKYWIYLIIPSSLEEQIKYELTNNKLNFKKEYSFYPHLSTEAFPDLSHDIIYFYSNFRPQEFYTFIVYIFRKFFVSFGLNLYEILH